MIESLNCPNCGAPQRQPQAGVAWVCIYCNSLIRLQAGEPRARLNTTLDAAELTDVKRLLISGKREGAIRLFQRLTDLDDEQAATAIEQMAAEFSMDTLFHQQLTPFGMLLASLSLALLPASLAGWWMGVLNPWLAVAAAALSLFGLFVYGRGGITTLRYWNAPIAPATTLYFSHIGAAQAGKSRLHTFLILLEVMPKEAPPFQARAIIPVRDENVGRVRQGEIIQVKYLPGKPDSVIFHQS